MRYPKIQEMSDLIYFQGKRWKFTPHEKYRRQAAIRIMNYILDVLKEDDSS